MKKVISFLILAILSTAQVALAQPINKITFDEPGAIAGTVGYDPANLFPNPNGTVIDQQLSDRGIVFQYKADSAVANAVQPIGGVYNQPYSEALTIEGLAAASEFTPRTAAYCTSDLRSVNGVVDLDVAGKRWICPVIHVLVSPSASVAADFSMGSVEVIGNLASLVMSGANGKTTVSANVISLSINQSNSPLSVSGSFGAVVVSQTNAQLDVSFANAATFNLDLSNSPTTIANSSLGELQFTAVNSPMTLTRSDLRLNGELVNSDLKSSALRLTERSNGVLQTTNSDLTFRKLSCVSANGTLATKSFRSKVQAILKRRVTVTKGEVKVSKIVRSKGREALKPCAKVRVDMVNGKVRI